MKKALSLAMAFIFAFSLAGMAMAKTTAGKAAPAKKTEKKAVKKARLEKLFGMVSAVDTTANTVTVKRKKGEVTLTVTPKTVIKWAAKKKITLDKVKTGDRLYARYKKENGTDTATYMSVRPPLKAKKAKKAKKKAATKTKKSK